MNFSKGWTKSILLFFVYVETRHVIPCQLALYLLRESLATILSKSYDVTRMAKNQKLLDLQALSQIVCLEFVVKE